MCPRFVFLLALRVPAWLRLERCSAVSKDAEILLLRHQVALLERRSAARPKLTWCDRALIVALLAVIPRPRRAGLRLPVNPATILRWHRDQVKRRWAAKSRPKSPGRPRKHPAITRLVLRMAPSWSLFLRSQAEAIIACDFFTVDLLDGTKAYVLAVIEHAIRRIHILGATAHPTHEWVTQ
jgi:hypothetical protein